jgi:hypothetical protein
LAELFTRRFLADPSSAVRAALMWQSSDEREDGVTHGWQAWLRWWPVDSFFPASAAQKEVDAIRAKTTKSRVFYVEGM